MSPPPPVRIAVIGCGVIGRVHMDAVQSHPQAQLTWVCDVRAETARAAAEETGAQAATDPIKIFAQPDVDGVILALPTGLRGPLAIAALKAGKHLLLEKPTAMNLAELDAIGAHAGDRIVAACSARMRFAATARAAEAFLRSGELGALRRLRCRVIAPAGPPPDQPPPPWRLRREANGGGIVANWGSYDFDFLFSLIAWEVQPQVVSARQWGLLPDLLDRAAPGSDAETHLSAFIRCGNDVLLTYERAECAVAPAEASWEFHGTGGCLRIAMADTTAPVRFDPVDKARGVGEPVTLHPGLPAKEWGHEGVVHDFVEAIREGRQPATPLPRARTLTALLDALYRSAEKGGESVALEA